MEDLEKRIDLLERGVIEENKMLGDIIDLLEKMISLEYIEK